MKRRQALLHRCRSWLALFALVLGSGCATQAFQRETLAETPALPLYAELSDVPFFPQQEHWCGPASLASVLQFSGVDVSPEQLAREAYLPQREGSLQMELLAAARARDRLAYVIEPDLTALLREIAGGHPVLVLQNLSFAWLPRWHYAVAVGFDLREGTVVLRSGTQERWTTSIAVFDRTWARGGRWAAVLLRPQELPASADPDRFVRAAHDLESTGRLQAAYQAYQAAAAAWPDSATSLFALGNLAYKLGDFALAEDALRRAIATRSEAAPLWNNLAYVLAARGCGDAAQAAAHCASLLAPDDPAMADTGRDIRAANATRPAVCLPVVCPAPGAVNPVLQH